MAQGNCAVFISLVFIAACSEEPVSADRSVDAEQLRLWVETLDRARPPATAHETPGTVAPVGQLIDGLEKRLTDNPADRQGWRLLAQSYAYVGDMPRARSAAEKAVTLGANRNELEAALLSVHSGQAD